MPATATNEKTPANKRQGFGDQWWPGAESNQCERMQDPSLCHLIHFVMVPNVDRNDFMLGDDEFKRNSVLQIDGHTVQAS